MKIFGILLALFFSSSAFAKKIGSYYPFPLTEEPIALFHELSPLIAVSEHNIYIQEGKVFVSLKTVKEKFLCAEKYGNSILIGSESGLYSIEIGSQTVTAVDFFVGKKVTELLSTANKYLYVCTEKQIYSSSNGRDFESIAKSNAVVHAYEVAPGEAWMVTKSNILIAKKAEVKSLDISTYFTGTPKSSFFDEKGFLWISNEDSTVVYRKITMASGEDTLMLKNRFASDENAIYSYIFIPEKGFLYVTTKGLFFNGTPRNLPLKEFGNKDFAYNITELMPTNVSEQLSRETGFKSATHAFLGSKLKNVWLLNSSGAIAVEIKDLEEFFK